MTLGIAGREPCDTSGYSLQYCKLAPMLRILAGIGQIFRAYMNKPTVTDFGVDPTLFTRARQIERRWRLLDIAISIPAIFIAITVAIMVVQLSAIIAGVSRPEFDDSSSPLHYHSAIFTALFYGTYVPTTILLVRQLRGIRVLATFRLIARISVLKRMILELAGTFGLPTRFRLGRRLEKQRRSATRHLWSVATDFAVCAGYPPSRRIDERWSRLSRAVQWSIDEPWDEQRIRTALLGCELALERLIVDGFLVGPLSIDVGGELVRPHGFLRRIESLHWRDIAIATVAGLLVLLPDKVFDVVLK